MAKLKKHFKHPHGGASCGSWVDNGRNLTENTRSVTCASCKKTGHYLNSGGTPLRAQPKVLKVEKPKPKPLFTVTEEVVEALRVIGKLSASYANQANVCGDYDRFIDHLNKKMPEGVVIPGRYNTYVVKVSKKGSGEFFTMEKKATTKENALIDARNEFGYSLRQQITLTAEEKS